MQHAMRCVFRPLLKLTDYGVVPLNEGLTTHPVAAAHGAPEAMPEDRDTLFSNKLHKGTNIEIISGKVDFKGQLWTVKWISCGPDGLKKITSIADAVGGKVFLQCLEL